MGEAVVDKTSLDQALHELEVAQRTLDLLSASARLAVAHSDSVVAEVEKQIAAEDPRALKENQRIIRSAFALRD